jgi:hypothetical protein
MAEQLAEGGTSQQEPFLVCRAAIAGVALPLRRGQGEEQVSEEQGTPGRGPVDNQQQWRRR